jgi:hypothetical protein
MQAVSKSNNSREMQSGLQSANRNAYGRMGDMLVKLNSGFRTK